MRETDPDMGGKSPAYDARGRWTGPHPAYEGWRPAEPDDWSELLGWLLAGVCAALVWLALRYL